MIKGVGVDIIEIERIKRAIDRNNNFIEKLFSDKEKEYITDKKIMAQYIAGRFSAKEAVSKALGTGFRGFGFKDIEIHKDKLGKPIVILNGRAKAIAEDIGDYQIELSISHDRDKAIAYAVMEVI
ncbi:holo-ACP synthase [Clostridium felsineum]|uniref:Holo-[acyl-carrier-protein] synthase n=1 Tax=Clostridium felsineum TaxID=36839 RepID=A0A1S8L8K3_9CLOT|nr:holo-ACP synthase [Clostridium felsineum]MCR3760558.1 holo-ACP synthase [Clostridium felsineum]URZ02127.1 Holo-[acyl-carrier-protein] synthase [Clostridium felsineum]URZ05103.1 Holo-[acyl-carrier-protein] synthase [Clostridium felsineum]URZ10144.1 Holo-[acyl-carrier-protein] synthase [Clostridium felsineum]URZ17960.1 Holo-[acyl-carrier-protein] synthase [Clostridium felsineum DSM 794]